MNTHITYPPGELTDSELITRIHALAHDERAATAQLVAHLAEFDTRRLHHAEGCSSLFTYCTGVLHFSEHAAYNRIAAARASRRFPAVLDRLADGSVHLTAVTLLAPHFTEDNHASLLEEARHRSKAQVLEIVARLKPMPVVPPMIRRLPVRSAETTAAAGVRPMILETPATPCPATPWPATPARPPAIVPLRPALYKIQFTASQEMRGRLMEAQALLRHRIPDGDPAAVLDLALKVLLKEIKRGKAGIVDQPRPGGGRTAGMAPARASDLGSPDPVGGEGRASRRIPAAVRRTVWVRDGGRCAFRNRTGRRCAEKGFLEFHHVKPHAAGGPVTVENIELRCRGHNMHEAELFFGQEWSPVSRGSRMA